MIPLYGRGAVDTALKAQGLETYALLGRDAIETLARESDPAAVERYGLLRSSGVVVVAFPYDARKHNDDSLEHASAIAPCSRDTGPAGRHGGPPPYARIGAFAAVNLYAALTRLLLGAGKALAADSGQPAKSFRALVNSRLPEKRLAQLSGLGFIGRSSLIITEAYGPSCVFGALLLPPEYVIDKAATTPTAAAQGGAPGASACGSCRACVDACPAGAIRAEAEVGAAFDKERCVQFWTTRPEEPPADVRAAWGERLYGCDECVAACPRSSGAWRADERGLSPAARACSRVEAPEDKPGRLVSVPFLLGASDEAIKAYFRHSALGMSWITPAMLRRNAEFAAFSGRTTI